jgi:hypothetical protein
MSTITIDQENAIREYLEGKHIPAGIGNEGAACSIAAINLALSGRLTDVIPDCMSPVIGRWIINVQDSMPDDMRNSDEWRDLLPLAAGTGREHEGERAQIILDWIWETVLPYLQDVADKGGFGEAWKTMTTKKTSAAADAAARAAYAAAYAAADAAARAAYAAAYAAADAAAYAAADAAAYAAAYAAADAAAYAAADAWKIFDPTTLLRKLVEVGTK